MLGKERAGRPDPMLGRASDPTGGTPRLEIPPTLGRTPLEIGRPTLEMPMLGREAALGRTPLGRAALRLRNAPLDRPTTLDNALGSATLG